MIFIRKHTLAFITGIYISKALFSQSIAINSSGNAANASSVLDISSSSKGILIPCITNAQKSAMNPLPSAAQGLLVYQTDGTEGFYYNDSPTTTPNWIYMNPASGTGSPVIKIKGSDESLLNSTTMQDDNDLEFYMGANETWAFEIKVYVNNSGTGPDIQVQITGPASPTDLRYEFQVWQNDVGGASNSHTMQTAYDTPLNWNWTANPVDTYLTFRGTVTNGATAGKLKIQWTQRVADVSVSTVVKRGSYLIATKF